MGLNNRYIKFEDSEVERICIANFSSDGKGVTYEDAAAVTSAQLGTKFRGSSIVTFDELRYFTGLTYIPDWAFYESYSLKSITFPNGLSSTGYGSLGRCTSLERISFGRGSVTPIASMGGAGLLKRLNVYSIEQYLQLCSGFSLDSTTGCFSSEDPHLLVQEQEITRFVFPSDVTEIKGSVLKGISSITEIVLPPNLTAIGKYAFYGTGIVSLTIPSTVTALYDQAFSGCESLRNITINATITALNSRMFNGCSSLTSVVLPQTLETTEGWDVFAACSSLKTITLPASFTAFNSYRTFQGVPLESMIILATTPPAGASNLSINNSCKFYVPYSSDHSVLNAYKSENGWSNFSNRFYELNQDGSVPNN